MITLLVIFAYAVGWLAFTVPAARFAADNSSLTGRCTKPRSSSNFRSICTEYHGRECWQAPGVISPGLILCCSVAGLVWPAALLPALAYFLATRKPTPLGLQRRIEQLERELSIGGHR